MRYKTLLPGLKKYVTECWLADEATTIRGAASFLQEAPNSAPVLTLFDNLQRDGVARKDDALSNRKVRVITEWNWTGSSSAGQSVRTGLELYLRAPLAKSADDEVRAQEMVVDGRTVLLPPIRQADFYLALTALRLVLSKRAGRKLGGSDTASRDEMLNVAQKIPVSHLPKLPSEVARLAPSAKAAEEYKRGLRNFLRYLAANDLVALHVPAPQQASPLGRWLEEHVPVPGPDEEGRAHARNERTYLYRLFAALKLGLGDASPNTPDELTIEQANDGLATLRRKNRRHAREVRSVLNSLGRRGLGPYRGAHGVIPMARVTDRHWAPAYVLGAGRDVKVQNNWAALGAMLAEADLPPIWNDFWTWYETFSTGDDETLMEKFEDEFSRPKIRHLKPGTARQRFMAVRHYVGMARSMRPEAGGELDPHWVFGAGFTKVTQSIRAAWKARAAAQATSRAQGVEPAGHAIADDSPTLARIIINGGLIAEALATFADYTRGRGGHVATDDQIKTWRKAYTNSERLSSLGMGKAVSLRQRKRIRKDLAAVLGDISGFALLPGSLKRIHRMIEARPDDRETALAVMRYFIAYLAATADRIGELALLRLDQHVKHLSSQVRSATSRGLWYCKLEEHERKAGVEHEVPWIPELIPEFVRTYYLTVARPLLMRDWKAAGKAPHEFLFVSPEDGGPFGGMHGETAEEIDRCVKNGSGGLSKQFTRWRVEQLRLQGYDVVDGAWGHHGPHSERARLTRLAQDCGLEMQRITFLLGHRGDTTAEKFYNCSEAEANAESLRMMLAAKPWITPVSDDRVETASDHRRVSRRKQEQTHRDAELGNEFRRLLAVVEAGDVTPKQVFVALGEIAEKHGVRLDEAS